MDRGGGFRFLVIGGKHGGDLSPESYLRPQDAALIGVYAYTINVTAEQGGTKACSVTAHWCGDARTRR